MFSRSLQVGRAFGLATLLLAGCQSGAKLDTSKVIAPDGKEDNFFSTTAQEYLASAEVELRIDAADALLDQATRLERAQELMEGKTQQIAWFLHVYLIDKSHEDGVAAKYGGLRAMVLDGTSANESLKADSTDPTKFTFKFTVQVGGTKELLSKVRKANGLSDSASTFPLAMAKLTSSEVRNFSPRRFAVGEWSPNTCRCELETVSVKLEPTPPSNDAYLDYGKMLADGKIDISIHYGWDYHARYDLTHSRDLYNWLVDTMGFTPPPSVSRYEQYHRRSGPLTRTVTINGRPIQALVTIFHPDPCESWDEDGPYGTWAGNIEEDPEATSRSCEDWSWGIATANANATTEAGARNMMDDLKQSMKTRDAIIYKGHTGYRYGYALASWYRTSSGMLDPNQLKQFDLPKDMSQVFAFVGCQSYHVAQAFRENPNKKNLVNADVITTTSFSDSTDGGTVQDIVKALVGDARGNFRASSYGQLMRALNYYTSDWEDGQFTMFGVHGIDDNPLANPLGLGEKTCTTCTTDPECGAAGNVCVQLNDREKVCAVECLHTQGCPSGYECRPYGDVASGALQGKACVPKSLTCTQTPPSPPSQKEFSADGQLGKDEQKRFSVPLTAGAKNLVVQMTGTGDADLYTRFSAPPTLTEYDCRPYKGSTNETCKHVTASSTSLEIMVNGYSNSSSFALKVTWQ